MQVQVLKAAVVASILLLAVASVAFTRGAQDFYAQDHRFGGSIKGE
jgi:hypothetical protein